MSESESQEQDYDSNSNDEESSGDIETEDTIDEENVDEENVDEEDENSEDGGVEEKKEDIVSEQEKTVKINTEKNISKSKNSKKKIKETREGTQINTLKDIKFINNDDSEDENTDDEMYLEKFDRNIIRNYLVNFHPETKNHNYIEIQTMTQVVRDVNGNIIDELHKTIPFLTKYEKTKILGQRAKQIESGSKPFVKITNNIIDSYVIAQMELKEKKIPFIIRRPLPNGSSEYWKLSDLQII